MYKCQRAVTYYDGCGFIQYNIRLIKADRTQLVHNVKTIKYVRYSSDIT